MTGRIRLQLIWHMHQPPYDVARPAVLPWTLLHAVKDYWEMAELVAECPKVKVTFNFAPVLLRQLTVCADSIADPAKRDDAFERYWAHFLKDDLSDSERAFIATRFFDCHRAAMVFPNPDYHRLWKLVEAAGDKASRYLDLPAFHDLQLHYFLAWLGPLARERFPELGPLLAKGSNFTRADKETVRQIYASILTRIIPTLRQLADAGRVGISTTPDMHPLFPLLARAYRARGRVPGDGGITDPDWHFGQAVRQHTATWGKPPDLLWPAEGAICDDTAAAMSRHNIRHAFSDRAVLLNSLRLTDAPIGPDFPYRPYRYRGVHLHFRDTELSDRIGFVYQGMTPDNAVQDFVDRLHAIGREHPEAVVSVILDGENAWEFFPEQGRPFLRALYRALASDSRIETILPGEALHGAQELAAIAPGSWVNGNFNLWAGHPEKDRAWALLADAASAIEACPDPARQHAALEHLRKAEASDWFWWYGDDHASEQKPVFDWLFRSALRLVYEALALAAPPDLAMASASSMSSLSGPNSSMHRSTIA